MVFSFSTAVFILWPLSKSSAYQTGCIKPRAHAAVQHNEKWPQTKVITQVFYSQILLWNELHLKSLQMKQQAGGKKQMPNGNNAEIGAEFMPDFWTTATPESHLSKLKCEKVKRKSTLCETWGHTRSVFYKFWASEAELQDQRFIGSSCCCF